MEYKFTIYGQVPSKSNCYKIITICGHSSLAKQKAVKDYELAFFKQCPFRSTTKTNPTIKGLFEIDLKIFYPNDRQDLGNAEKVIMDCLQTCGVIDNDRKCIDYHSRRYTDKNNPRIEVLLNTVDL